MYFDLSNLESMDASIVLTLDGNSDIGAQSLVLNMFKALDREQSLIGFFSLEKTYFPSCVRNMFSDTI